MSVGEVSSETRRHLLCDESSWNMALPFSNSCLVSGTSLAQGRALPHMAMMGMYREEGSFLDRKDRKAILPMLSHLLAASTD
jgi:hypothetical protein